MNRYIKGRESILYIKYNDIWCPISCEVSSGISEQTQMTPTTTRANQGWATSKPTEQSYTIDFQGQAIYEGGANILSYWRIREMKRNRQLVEWRRVTVSGAYIDEGKGIFTSVSDANEADTFVTFSASLEGFGRPTYTQDIIDGDEYDCGCNGTTTLGLGGFIDITEQT